MTKIPLSLIQQLVQKLPEAYNQYYLQTVDMFYRYLASRYVLSEQDKEDILSDFYVKFWKVVDRYDETYAFETYMWIVFRNVVKDYFKKEQRVSFADELVVEELSSEDDHMLDILEHTFQFEDIQRAMQSIDDASYEIIFLKFIEQRSYEEIADELSISQDAVRQRISRGLKKLKSLLEENTIY